MEIVFVTPEFLSESGSFDGGLANYIFKVSKCLVDSGHSVSVCVSASEDHELSFQDIKVHRINVRNKLISILDYLSLKKLSPLLRYTYHSYKLNKYILNNFNKDVVVHYTSYTSPSLFCFLLPHSKKIIRYSGYQPDIYFEYNNKNKDLNYFCIKLLEDIVLRQKIKKFAPSELLKSRLTQVSNSLNLRLIRTPFEIDTNLDLRPIENGLKDKKYLLFFGSVGVLKGILDLVEALNSVLDFYQDLHFVCIGKDSFYNGESVKGIVASKLSRFKNRIHLFDRMSRDCLYSYIKHSHRVVLPSRLDNLPNALLESLGYCKIVIATKNSSLDEIIVEGYNGFLCENTDPVSLRDALVRSLELNRSSEESMIRNIVNTSKNFTLIKHINELLKFYEESDK